MSDSCYGKNDNKKQNKKMENWVDFVKSKRAYSEPTRHSEGFALSTSQTKPTQIDLLIWQAIPATVWRKGGS